MTVSEPSILEPGHGLFNTHVTLEDLGAVVQEQLNTKSKLGRNTKLTVIGEGNGIMSRIILVQPEWTAPEDHLPSKFVVKIPFLLHLQSIFEKMRSANPMSKEQEAGLLALFVGDAQQFFNREINLYKILEKWNKKDVMLNPKMYFSKKFDSENTNKAFYGMEFAKDIVVRHANENVTPTELCPVLKSLAHLQAGSLHLTDEEKQSVRGYDIVKIIGPIMNEDGIKSMFKQARELNPDRFTEKVNKIEAFGMEVVNFELAANLNKYVGIKQDVFVHGDLWSPNILWSQQNEKYYATKIIDYAGIHFGNPAEDLVRLFVSTLSGANRQNYWERLLEKFYKYFLEALDNTPAPYTLDQLKESYRCYFVIGAIGLLPMFGHVVQAMMTTCKEPEKLMAYNENVTEKLEKLFEDVERFHLHTRNTVKNYKKPVERN